MADASGPLTEFIVAACVPLDAGHGSGTLERAEAILAAYPGLGTNDIHAAAILGDDVSIRRFLALDPTTAKVEGGPRGWDALTYLCFSNYLRLDPRRSSGFVRAAEALLNAGADANTGFYSRGHQLQLEFESVLYGAAGVAHHAELTRLLLGRGADPNDGEVTYHSPETSDNAALKILVESGKLTPDSMATMLLRKADWHDAEGIKFLLGRGADPNRLTHWGFTALHQALRRDNVIQNIEVLLDHGANPMLDSQVGMSALVIAARRGRGDVLDLVERRGIPVELRGFDRLVAACARNRPEGVSSLTNLEPSLVAEVRADGGKLLAEFAGNGNTDGVRRLLELGVDIQALYKEGDGYFDVAKNSTALHVAAWRARHGTVKFLVEQGASVDALDGKRRTPLALAVRACVDSHWMHRRSPESVQILLQAGASAAGVAFPSGYMEVDELLKS